MAANQYFDFKLCNFVEYDIWKCMKNLNINQETRNKLLKYDKIIKKNIKTFNRNIRFPCRMSLNYIKNVIYKIYPIDLFGSRYNFVKFFNIIKKICTATFYENVFTKSLIKGWRLNNVEWLANVEEKNKYTNLTQVIIWLITIFKTKILKRLFYLQMDLKSYKINYFPINHYRSLYTKSINEMITNKKLLKVETKRVVCMTKLRIFPRAHMTSHRPIIQTRLLRTLNKKKVSPLLRNKGALFQKNMYTAWSEFVEATKDQLIYGVKIDIKDAFSNVNIDELKPLLKHFLKKEPICLNNILKSLEKQIVRVGKHRYFYWNRGLMQGMKLSAHLCNLSRAFFDKKFLTPFINNTNFFYRTIDDYFFCSSNMNEVLRFQDILQTREIISEEKTQTNISDDKKILFNGRLFNLKTKEIEIYVDSNLETYRYKSKLFYKKSNVADSIKFLQDIGNLKTNSYNFDKLLLNLKFNSNVTVLQNYFKAMIIIAFKIDCAIKERLEEVPNDLHLFVVKLVKFYVGYVRKKLAQTKIIKDKCMHITRNMLKCIGIKAFILVLQKRYLFYENHITFLKLVVKNIKHSMIGTKFNKLPEEFKNIKMKRVLQQYK